MAHRRPLFVIPITGIYIRNLHRAVWVSCRYPKLIDFIIWCSFFKMIHWNCRIQQSFLRWGGSFVWRGSRYVGLSQPWFDLNRHFKPPNILEEIENTSTALPSFTVWKYPTDLKCQKKWRLVTPRKEEGEASSAHMMTRRHTTARLFTRPASFS